jgi:hypothetical protein
MGPITATIRRAQRNRVQWVKWSPLLGMGSNKRLDSSVRHPSMVPPSLTRLAMIYFYPLS